MRLAILAIASALNHWGFTCGWKSENDCKNDILKLAKLFGENHMSKPFADSVRASSGPYCAESPDPKLCDQVFKRDWTPAIKVWMADPEVVVGFCEKATK